jgi:hypothetical protein
LSAWRLSPTKNAAWTRQTDPGPGFAIRFRRTFASGILDAVGEALCWRRKESWPQDQAVLETGPKAGVRV